MAAGTGGDAGCTGGSSAFHGDSCSAAVGTAGGGECPSFSLNMLGLFIDGRGSGSCCCCIGCISWSVTGSGSTAGCSSGSRKFVKERCRDGCVDPSSTTTTSSSLIKPKSFGVCGNC